jgi:1,4-dihydroxy-2-naphthoyl-CoA hydrolase
MVSDRGDERDGLSRAIGVEYLDLSAEHAVARFEVTDTVRQPFGIVHGGAFATLAESLCSRATHAAVAADGMVAMGQANQASFIRPVASGHVTCEATARHRGRSTWVWDCDLSDDQGRLCALARLTIAVRPAPD